MINWKNTAENLGLVLVALIVGVMIGYFVTISAAKTMIAEQKSLIEQAINKESIKNEIKNELDFKIDKIKNSDSLKIILNQKPDNKQDPVNVIVPKNDTIIKKKGFFRKIFGKK